MARSSFFQYFCDQSFALRQTDTVWERERERKRGGEKKEEEWRIEDYEPSFFD